MEGDLRTKLTAEQIASFSALISELSVSAGEDAELQRSGRTCMRYTAEQDAAMAALLSEQLSLDPDGRRQIVSAVSASDSSAPVEYVLFFAAPLHIQRVVSHRDHVRSTALPCAAVLGLKIGVEVGRIHTHLMMQGIADSGKDSWVLGNISGLAGAGRRAITCCLLSGYGPAILKQLLGRAMRGDYHTDAAMEFIGALNLTPYRRNMWQSDVQAMEALIRRGVGLLAPLRLSKIGPVSSPDWNTVLRAAQDLVDTMHFIEAKHVLMERDAALIRTLLRVLEVDDRKLARLYDFDCAGPSIMGHDLLDDLCGRLGLMLRIFRKGGADEITRTSGRSHDYIIKSVFGYEKRVCGIRTCVPGGENGQAAGHKTLICSRCQAECYCGREHQKLDYQVHRMACWRWQWPQEEIQAAKAAQ